MVYFRYTSSGSGKGNTVTVTCAEEFAGLTITLSKTGKTYTKTCPSTAPYVVTFNGVENGTYTVSCTVDGQTYSETVVVQDISCVLNYGFSWKLWVDTASQLSLSDYASLSEVLADEKALRELFLEHACVDYMAELTSSNEDLETVINNDLCAKRINLSDYALDFLGANTVIKALMDEADKYGYGEWVLMPQVPKMTSNTAPYGEAFASGTADTSYAYNAFDGNDSTKWQSVTGTENLGKVGYKFATPTCVRKIRHYIEFIEVSTYKVQYSDDGTNFTDVPNSTYQSNSSGYVELNIADCGSHLYWCIAHISASATTRAGATTLQFYAWAPKGNVPVMTANTAPYGTAFSDSQYDSSMAAYKAFDDDDSSSFVPNYGAAQSYGTYVGYEFTNPILAKKAKVTFYEDQNATTNFHFKFQGYVNGTWVDLCEEQTIDLQKQVPQTYEVELNTSSYAMKYQLICDKAHVSGVHMTKIRTLQFYGRELKVSVPTMTSNTTPFGEASAQYAPNTNEQAWKAFDGDSSASSKWAAGINVSSQQSITAWLQYKFPSKVHIDAMYIATDIPTLGAFAELEILASENGTNFSPVKTENYNDGNAKFIYGLDTDSVYFRANITWKNTDSQPYGAPRITVLQFYGKDYSEKEFEAGTTKKWLYDHGVELEEFYMNSVGEKGSYYLKASKTTADATSTSACSTENVVDTTNYSLFRAKEGMNGYNSGSSNNGQISLGVVPVKGVMDGTTAIAIRDNVITDAPNNLYLDISNVNSSYYLAFGWGWKYALDFDLTELWLE